MTRGIETRLKEGQGQISVVQQGLLVDRVLHLRDLLQVAQLKALSLGRNTTVPPNNG